MLALATDVCSVDMNNDPTPLRVRALRITDRRDGNWSRTIVIEDVERSRFQTGLYWADSPPPDGWKTILDRHDAWSALNTLRALGLYAEYSDEWSTEDSVDAVLSRKEIEMQKLWDDVDQPEEAQRPVPKLDEVAGQQAGLMATSAPTASPVDRPTTQTEPIIKPVAGGKGASKEEMERARNEVWDYAGGNRWKWKSVGLTPAGRECDVLMFSGSEIIIVGRTSIEIPPKSK